MVLVSLTAFSNQFNSVLALLSIEEAFSLQNCINRALQVITEQNKELIPLSECLAVIRNVTQCFGNCQKIQRAIQGILLDLSNKENTVDLGPIEPPKKRLRMSSSGTVAPMDVEETTRIEIDYSPYARVLDPWVEYARASLLVRILLRNLHGFLPFDLLGRISEKSRTCDFEL